MNRKSRKGFSLIELVIVVLILGIIAAVAAPRMFDTASTAEENTTRQQLAVMRNAIEMYRARNAAYPTDLTVAMSEMLNGSFPVPMVGTARNKPGVHYDATTTDVDAAVDVGVDAGWAYKAHNGSLRLNVADATLGSDW
ncbi:Type II secretion system protein G precursor [Rubripirellula lacrimiformis]|uniref:Type II secretion system protein G n=1 Tax=Rubripirellula lacrimiformis TaxID=1930273 RepID=A0A517NHT5_9BACT|nr:prepilin-type N-terminal cleavage/methylation domain-containing protein [Rubripirellula lacrimiformis]QDT06695.1 Type II secretion system protein G precursor [Rubripirellula lacrimiformis]